MANIARKAADTLVTYLETAIPSLAGRIHSAVPGPEHQAMFPCAVILTKRLRFNPVQAEIVYQEDDTVALPINTPGTVVWNIGSFSSMVEIRIYSNSVPQREALEDAVLQALMANVESAGVLNLKITDLQVGTKATLYDAPISFALEDTEWQDDYAFENRRFAFITLDAVFPALVSQTEYTIEEIQLELTHDMVAGVLEETDITGIVLDDLSDPLTLYQLRSEEGQPNGYASLGPDGLVPDNQLPANVLNASYQLRSEEGQPNGYASLDASGLVPVSQLPPLDFQETAEKDQPNGYAGLDASGLVPSAEIPVITATQHGNQTNQALHALATQALAGFLSSADKTKLDNFGSNVLTFKPGAASGNGSVATWAEVDAYAAAAAGPWTLFIDPSITQAEVPAGADTDFRSICTIDIIGSVNNAHLLIKDTGKIRNFAALYTGAIWIEAITEPGVIFDVEGGLLRLREGGTLANIPATSLVPAVEMQQASNFVIATLTGGALRAEEPIILVSVPNASNGFFIFANLLNTQGGFVAISPDCISITDLTSTVLAIHDGTARLDNQSGTILTPVMFVPVELSQFINWQNGDTASRPTITVTGQPYFDTDLGKPIWWSGANWVDATGTVV